jgi:hypothetical protein
MVKLLLIQRVIVVMVLAVVHGQRKCVHLRGWRLGLFLPTMSHCTHETFIERLWSCQAFAGLKRWLAQLLFNIIKKFISLVVVIKFAKVWLKQGPSMQRHNRFARFEACRNPLLIHNRVLGEQVHPIDEVRLL